MADVPACCRNSQAASSIALIAQSHLRLLGTPLVDEGADVVASLWNAPRVIVAHGTGPDPIFFFGNAEALRAFECDFAAFTTLPSRLSAESPDRAERQRLLDRVARDGFIDDYAGMRVSARGRRFRIEHATVWNLVDSHGAVHGQAATFVL